MDGNDSYDEELHGFEDQSDEEWNPNKRPRARTSRTTTRKASDVSASDNRAPSKSRKAGKATARPSVDASAWNLEIELQFIGIMEQYPQIWDSKETDSRFSGKKQPLWEEIMAKVPLLKPLQWTQVRQKWANFVNSYNKIANQRRVTKSGQAADNKTITWPYWEAMRFYHKSRVTNTVVSESNLNPISSDIVVDEFAANNNSSDLLSEVGGSPAPTTSAASQQRASPAPSTSAATQSRAASASSSNASGKAFRKNYRRDASDERTKALESLEQVSTTMKELVQKSGGPHAQFGNFVAASLNQLPERYQRTAQLQIKKILCDITAKAVNEELLADERAQHQEFVVETLIFDEKGNVLGAEEDSVNY